MKIPEALLIGRNWRYFQIQQNGYCLFKHPINGRIYNCSISGSDRNGYYLCISGESNYLPFEVLNGIRGIEEFKHDYVYRCLHYQARDGDFPWLRSPEDVVRVLAKIDHDLYERYGLQQRLRVDAPLTPEECLADASANAHAMPDPDSYPESPEPEPDLFPTKKHYSLKFEL